MNDIFNEYTKDYLGFNVLGFPKCGQESLVGYLRKKYSNLHHEKNEILWRKDALELWEKQPKRLKPVIIKRDPIERMWSGYYYFLYANSNYTFEMYLNLKAYDPAMGEENPVSGSNYEKWIKPFKKFNPLIVNIEDVKKLPDFPHINETKKVRGHIYNDIPKMPQWAKTMAKEYLDKEIKTNKEPSWSIDTK